MSYATSSSPQYEDPMCVCVCVCVCEHLVPIQFRPYSIPPNTQVHPLFSPYTQLLLTYLDIKSAVLPYLESGISS